MRRKIGAAFLSLFMMGCAPAPGNAPAEVPSKVVERTETKSEKPRFKYVIMSDEEKKVFVREDVLNQLVFIYDGMQRELPLCVYGRAGINGVFIDKIAPTVYVRSDEVSANFSRDYCTEEGTNYIGLVHNHPEGECGMSQIDFNRFVPDKESKLEMIICNTKKGGEQMNYVIYTRPNDPVFNRGIDE